RRADVVRASGGFPDADVGDDWAVGVSLALRGRVRVLDAPGRVYRFHRGSVSASWTPRDRLGAAALVRAQVRHDPAVPLTLRLVSTTLSPAHWFVLRVLR